MLQHITRWLKDYATDVSRIENIKDHPYPLLGRLIGRAALPAQLSTPKLKIELEQKRKQLLETPNCRIKRFSVLSTRKAKLDTIEINPDATSHIPKNQRLHVVYCMGNRDFYEQHQQELLETATQLSATVIGFNYRNVGESTGIPIHQQDLLDDGMAQLNRLLHQKKIPSHRIIIVGHSLGGGIANILADKLHQKKQPCYLYNDRSYSSLINAALEMFLGKKVAALVGTIIGGIFGVLLGFSAWTLLALMMSATFTMTALYVVRPQWIRQLLSPIFHIVMGKAGWYLNAKDAYLNIPAQYKAYTMIKAPKNPNKQDAKGKTIATWYQDTCMQSAALGLSLKEQRKFHKEKAKTQTEHLPHYYALKPIKLISHSHSPHQVHRLHGVLPQELVERHSTQNAQDFFTKQVVEKRWNLK